MPDSTTDKEKLTHDQKVRFNILIPLVSKIITKRLKEAGSLTRDDESTLYTKTIQELDNYYKKIMFDLVGGDEGLRKEITSIMNVYRASPKREKYYIDQLLALLNQSKLEIEKAYGGCQKCYGKGYSTWRHGETYRGKTHNMRNDTKFCTCDRGTQLETLQNKSKLEMLERLEKVIDPTAFESVDQQIHNYEELCDAIQDEKERVKNASR